MSLPQRAATHPESREKHREKRACNKRSCATKAQANSKRLKWAGHLQLATCNLQLDSLLRATCYRCHSPAGLAVRHMQIPVEVKVEHAQLGHSPLPQRNVRRRCPSSSSSSSTSCSRSRSCCCHASSCSCSSSCCGSTLRIRVHHDGATRCGAGKQAMRRVAPTMVTTAATTTMMTMMSVPVVMLVVLLQRIEAAGGTARE